MVFKTHKIGFIIVDIVNFSKLKSQIFGMINDYNRSQEKINASFDRQVEVIKRKSEDNDTNEEEDETNKKSKLDDSSNIISKHAKYFK